MDNTDFTQSHAEVLARVDTRTILLEQRVGSMDAKLDKVSSTLDDLLIKMSGVVFIYSQDHEFAMTQSRWTASFRGNLKWFSAVIASAGGTVLAIIYNWYNNHNFWMIRK